MPTPAAHEHSRWRLLRAPAARTSADIGLGVVLGGYAALAALTSDEYPHPGPATALLMGLAGLSLALRRRRPTAAFLGAFGFMTVLAVVLGPYQAGTSVLIGVVGAWSAMAYGVGWPLFGVAVTAFAVSVSTGDLPDSAGGAVFVVGLLGLVGAAGRTSRRLREVSAANVALRELLQLESGARTQAALEDERGRIARELHDILSHTLGVVALQTGAADHAWDSDPQQARTALRTARALSLEALDQLKALLRVVREGEQDQGAPVPTLDELPALAARSSHDGFRVDLEVIGDPRPVSPQLQASVYRVAQEGVANAMKHSSAHGCTLQLRYDDHQVSVLVSDSGRPRAAGDGARMGLRGVAERVALFGGRVEAGPGAAGGWCLQAEFPT